MYKVAVITENQAQSLIGVQYKDRVYFNPVLDKDDNLCISEEEINDCKISWLKELPLINYVPKDIPKTQGKK